jgi:hypothetical protein
MEMVLNEAIETMSHGREGVPNRTMKPENTLDQFLFEAA